MLHGILKKIENLTILPIAVITFAVMLLSYCSNNKVILITSNIIYVAVFIAVQIWGFCYMYKANRFIQKSEKILKNKGEISEEQTKRVLLIYKKSKYYNDKHMS